MPVFYKSTVWAKCWKQHTCSACGCVYRYKFERSAEGNAGAPEVARLNAQDALNQKMRQEIDVRPCPTCGYVQPDMIAKGKLLWHSAFAVLSLVLLPCVLIPAMANGMSLDVAAVIAAGIVGVAALGHLGVVVYDYNADREKNKRDAERDVALGKTEVATPGSAENFRPTPSNLSFAHLTCLVAVLAAAPAFIVPVYLRANNNIPTNPNLTPEVISPGDEVTVNFDDKIQTVRGNWSGSATVQVLNPGEVGTIRNIGTATSNHTWGDSFRVKSSESNYTTKLWVKLALPEDAALGGKTLKVRISLTATYPHMLGNRTFKDQMIRVSKDVTMHIAEPEVARTYRSAWQTAASIGTLASVVGGGLLVLLALSLKSKAEPSQVASLGTTTDDPAWANNHNPLAGPAPQIPWQDVEAATQSRWGSPRPPAPPSVPPPPRVPPPPARGEPPPYEGISPQPRSPDRY